MAEIQSLANPQEFTSDIASGGGVSAPTSIRTPGEKRPLIISHTIPRVTINIPTGVNKVTPVSVVDKGVNFHPPVELLRARFDQVVRRAVSDRTMVYDADGKLIARFEDWNQAKAVFKKAGILEVVEKQIADRTAKRLKEEKEAAEKEAAKLKK